MRKPRLPSEYSSSLSRSRSKASEPFEPLISHVKWFLRPWQKRDASIVPTAPFSNATVDSTASSTLAARHERLRHRRRALDLADEVAGEVDHVRAEVAERARARLGLVEAPDVALGGAPLLEVGAAEVLDLAQLAGLDDLAREPHRRHEAVVEGAHVLDAGRLDALPGLVGLVGVAPERLLADHVLAGLGGRDRRLGVEVVRAGVVEQLDAVVGDDRPPVGDVVAEPVAARGLGDRRLVAPRDRHELRQQRRRPRHVGQRLVRVRVRLAHERVAEHADADRLDVAAVAGVAHREEPDLGHVSAPSRTRRRRRRSRGRSPSAARTRARPARPSRGPCPSPPTRSRAGPRSRSG